MDATDEPRAAIDSLRRLASGLLAASGLAPARASALAVQLLWYEEAGLPRFGLASLPGLLDRIGRGEISPQAQGKVGRERAATAVLDGQGGPGPLILARAAEIAVEKARDVGVGLVRVRGIGPTGPAAVVAEMAIGPVSAVALGPDGAWSVALPSAEGLPLVGDSALGGGADPPEAMRFPPWQLGMEDGEWMIQAVSVAALEPLASLHERVASAARSAPDLTGWLRPDLWETRRREAREQGVRVTPEILAALDAWSIRLGVANPLVVLATHN